MQRLAQQKREQKLIKPKVKKKKKKKNRERKKIVIQRRERERIVIAHECEALMTVAIWACRLLGDCGSGLIWVYGMGLCGIGSIGLDEGDGGLRGLMAVVV